MARTAYTDPRSVSDQLAAIGVTHEPGQRDSGLRVLRTESGAVLATTGVLGAISLLNGAANAA